MNDCTCRFRFRVTHAIILLLFLNNEYQHTFHRFSGENVPNVSNLTTDFLTTKKILYNFLCVFNSEIEIKILAGQFLIQFHLQCKKERLNFFWE